MTALFPRETFSELKSTSGDLVKKKIHIPYNPAAPLLRICSDQALTYMCMRMSTQHQEASECPSAFENAENLCNIPTVKMNELLQLAIAVILDSNHVIMNNSHQHNIE